MASNIILVDIIGEIVDSMRATENITASVENSGVYTLTSVNSLGTEFIVIDNIEYLTTPIDGNSFSIEGVTGLDFTGKSWKALAPYYEHGHPVEIMQTLNSKNHDDYVYKKYPLIALFEDFPSDIDVNDDGLLEEANPDIAIVNFTDKNIKANERYNLNYRKVLFPLYYSFIQSCIDSKWVQTRGRKGFNHTRTNALYYGTRSDNGNTANKLSDPLDAITLTSTTIKIRDLRCN